MKMDESVATKIASWIFVSSFVSVGVGSLYNQVPRWPNKFIWSTLAFSAAFLISIYNIKKNEVTLRLGSLSVLVCSSFRGVGYLVGGPIGLRLVGSGVWFAVFVLALAQHHYERKRYS